MTKKECEYYVRGMWDLLWILGDESHCKSYDPLMFSNNKVHSYVLNFEDGGRHHTYRNVEDVADCALLETAERFCVEFDITPNWNEYMRNNIIERINKRKEGKAE